MSIVGGYGSYRLIRQIIFANRSHHWPTTSGEIITSEKVRGIDDEGLPTFKTNIRYRYDVEDQVYVGERITFADYLPDTTSRNRVHRLVIEYSIGKTVSIYYHSEIPEISVLEPGIGSTFVFILLTMTMFIALTGLIISIIVASQILKYVLTTTH